MVSIALVNDPLRRWSGILGIMVPGTLGLAGVPGPDPQRCESDYSQSQEWSHQGCPSQCKEGLIGQNQVQRDHEGLHETVSQHQCCGPSSCETY